MAEKRKLEFFLLRYVPDAVKGEFVNFGVMALERAADGPRLVDVRFTKDWGRVLCLDPQADLDVLSGLLKDLRQEIGLPKDGVSLLRRMEDSFSSVVHVSPLMPALTEKLTLNEIDDVAGIFLEVPKLRRVREPAGRQRILETMRGEFERAGVLVLLNSVPAEPYTKAGDPFEFDFGYRFGNEIKLFQAVSMKPNVDGAVLLAARYPKIVPAMIQIAGAAPLLTAVVEAELDETRTDVGFALEMMKESQISVAETTGMPDIARMVRRDLGA